MIYLLPRIGRVMVIYRDGRSFLRSWANLSTRQLNSDGGIYAVLAATTERMLKELERRNAA